MGTGAVLKVGSAMRDPVVHRYTHFIKLFSNFTNIHIFREPTSSSLLEDTQALLLKNPLGGSSSNNNSNQKTPPRLDISNKLSGVFSQPSPTVNTKEAMNLMKEMWGSSQKAEPVKPKFQIFQEPAEPKAATVKPQFQIFQEPAEPKPAPVKPQFQIFQEPKEPPKPKFQIYEEAKAAEPKFEIFQDKENILKPNIIIQNDDDDEDNPKTMFVPSMEDFAKVRLIFPKLFSKTQKITHMKFA